jgi:hypothetical protein
MKSYFKNRKQLKKEKKTLRRENRMKLKMKFDKEKELLFSHTPIEIDGMGNITRLINGKGSILPTETEMFGCDIEKSVLSYVRKFIDKIGYEEMIRVPIRTKGLTGSGKKGECHQNVIGLVKRFGGKRLSGYVVIMSDNHRQCNLIGHSVWITPEGKCVDITNNYPQSYRDGMDEDSIIRKGDKDYILFVPVGLGIISKLGRILTDSEFRFDWYKEGITLTNTVLDNKDYPISIKQFDIFQKEIGLVSKLLNPNDDNIEELISYGGFSQKSLGSGKSWDELKSEIVW